MAMTIRRVEYFYCTVEDKPGESYKMLQTLADVGVNLLAFTAIPTGPTRTQFTLFPEDPHKMVDVSKKAGQKLDGPYQAFLVWGEDAIGALTGVHEKLYAANVNVYASTGVTNGRGSYGYIIYVRPEEFERAARALDL